MDSLKSCCDINGFLIDPIPRPEPHSTTGKYKSYAERLKRILRLMIFNPAKGGKTQFPDSNMGADHE